MASGANKNNGCFTFLAIVFLVIFGIFITVKNILNVPILRSFGFSQYAANIVHLHRDSYIQALSKTEIYKKPILISELQNNPPFVVAQKNARLQLKGYINKENISWLSVQFHINGKSEKGAILVPSRWDEEKNGLFKKVPENDMELFKANRKTAYKKEVFKRLRLIKVEGNLDIQKYRESKQYTLVKDASDNPNIEYFSNVSDEAKMNTLWKNYLSFDAIKTAYSDIMPVQN